MAARQHCMFWVGSSYQTCLDGVTEIPGGSSEGFNVFLNNGDIYTRHYKSAVDSVQLILGGERERAVITSGAFFHFQEWKKQYCSWGLNLPPRGLAQTPVLATQSGFIALPAIRHKYSGSNHEILGRNPASWIYLERASLQYCTVFGAVDRRRGTRKCKLRVHATDMQTIVGAKIGPAGESPTLHGSDAIFSQRVGELHDAQIVAAARGGGSMDGHEGEDENDLRFDVTLAAVAVVCPEDAAAHDFGQEWASLELNAGRWHGPKNFVVAVCQDTPGTSGEKSDFGLLADIFKQAHRWLGADTHFVFLGTDVKSTDVSRKVRLSAPLSFCARVSSSHRLDKVYVFYFNFVVILAGTFECCC